MLLWIAAARAAALGSGLVFGDPGPEIDTGLTGLWPNALPTDTGWVVFHAKAGDYFLTPTDDAFQPSGPERALLSRDDTSDHNLRVCPDGSWLIVSSFPTESYDDSLLVTRLQPDDSLAAPEVFAQQEAVTAANGVFRDMPLVCTDTFVGTGMFSGGTTYFPILEDASVGTPVALGGSPPSTGSAYLDVHGALHQIGFRNQYDNFQRGIYNADLSAQGITPLDIAQPGWRFSWSLGFTQAEIEGVGTVFLAAHLAQEEGVEYPGHAGQIAVEAFDADGTLLDQMIATDRPVEGPVMWPSFAWKDGQLTLLYAGGQDSLRVFARALPLSGRVVGGEGGDSGEEEAHGSSSDTDDIDLKVSGGCGGGASASFVSLPSLWLLQRLLRWLLQGLAPTALAAPVFGEPGDVVELGITGNWPKPYPRDDGGWTLFYAGAGDLQRQALGPDFSLEGGPTRMIGREGFTDHNLQPCPDGTWLHSSSFQAISSDDSLLVRHYAAGPDGLPGALLEETTPLYALVDTVTRDTPLICGEQFVGAGTFSPRWGTEGTHYHTLNGAVTEHALTGTPAATGTVFAEDPAGFLVELGFTPDGTLRAFPFDPSFTPQEAISLGRPPEGWRWLWVHYILPVEDGWLIANLGQETDAGWVGHNGQIVVHAIGPDWTLLDSAVVTAFTPPDGAMWPGLAVVPDPAAPDAGTLWVFYTIDPDHPRLAATPVSLDLSALRRSRGHDSGEDSGEDSGADSGSDPDSGHDTPAEEDSAHAGEDEGAPSKGTPGRCGSALPFALLSLTLLRNRRTIG